MDRLKRLLQEQPAIITALFEAALAMLTAFGLGWSAEQVAAVMGFVNLVGGVIVYLLVMPMSKVKRIENERDTAFAQANEALRALTNSENAARWLVAERDHQIQELTSMPSDAGPGGGTQ